jgi:uncharacterized repeat protein (TIGR03803 family)
MAGPERPPTLEHAMKLKTLVCLSLITLIASFGAAAHAQTFSVIHAFAEPNGAFPLSGVTIRAGVLYGTTICLRGLDNNCITGTVYQMVPVGSNWYYTPILLFSGDVETPQARVVFGPDNRLYGTTLNGGGPQGQGAVFSLTPGPTICTTANCFWVENVLHLFTGSPDGGRPGYGDLVWDPMGNIYGTTYYGGTSNRGTVFQMTKSGNDWTEAPIYSFTGPDGDQPWGGVILDGSGNLFGTTAAGGLYLGGTVFQLTYTQDSGWTETMLYNFQGPSDGQSPIAGLVRDSSGNLYGATSDGGVGVGGTVFELSPVGNSWAFTLLYSFTGPLEHNCGPYASLTIDNSGSLYGTTKCDGANKLGNVFKLTKTQNGWEYTSLHDFSGTDGAYPISNVTIDTDGTLYGTASVGGNSSCYPEGDGCGTVWMIRP